MYKHFKRLFQQTLIYGLGDTISKLVTILTLPIFTHYLSPKDYGIISILTVTSVLIIGLADLGFSSSLFRFFHEKKGKYQKTLVSTAQLATAGFATFVAILASPFSHQISTLFFKSPDYSYAVLLSFWTIPLTMVSIAPFLYLRLKDKAKSYALITLIRVITGIGINIFLVAVLKRGLVGILEGGIINAALYALILGIYSFRTNGIYFSKKLFQKMFLFGYPFIFSAIFLWVMDWADRFILVRLTNLSEVGLYSLGYYVGMAIMLPAMAFGVAWSPFFMSIFKERAAPKIFSFVLTYYSLIIGFLSLLVVILAPDCFRYFTTSQFYDAYTVVPLITLAYALKGSFDIVSVGSFIKKRPILQFYSEIIAMTINIILMFILIPIFGRVGAAWATAVAFISMPLTIYLFSYKLYPIRYEIFRLGQILAISFGIYFLTKAIYEPTVINLLYRLLLLTLFPLFLFIFGFFNEGEKKRLALFRNKFLERNN